MIPAVYTKCITPHPLLQPYIRYYAIRKFDTEGLEFPKPILADHDPSLTFFIRSKLSRFDSLDKEKPAFEANKNGVPECPFEGIQTFTKGFAIFKGITLLLTIHFMAIGIFHIFNLCPGDLCDYIYAGTDIVSDRLQLLQEELHETYEIPGTIAIVEKFLIKNLLSQKQLYRNKGIVKAFSFLNTVDAYNIKQLASDCNMTLQTFEVQFINQAGIGPKEYLRLKRFSSAVNFKLYNPNISWTEVANACGYYDQSHLIKDFRDFNNLSPKEFMKFMHPPVENFE